MEDYFILIALSAFAILIGLWNMIIAVLGCFPKCRADALGTLAKTITMKNISRRHGGYIPMVTKYTYIYTVNGKQYKYSGEKKIHKRRLLSNITVVYVKGFPRHAYPNKFTGLKEWGSGICLILVGSMFLWVCFTA